MISVHLQGKPCNITVIQVYAKETEVEWFYEDLQDLLELTPKKDVLFIIGDWNAKVGRQETPGNSVSLYLFLGSEITADGDCSHEIKRCLLLGRKVMINLDNIFKSRDITLSTKVRLGYGFSSSHVWM